MRPSQVSGVHLTFSLLRCVFAVFQSLFTAKYIAHSKSNGQAMLSPLYTTKCRESKLLHHKATVGYRPMRPIDCEFLYKIDILQQMNASIQMISMGPIVVYTDKFRQMFDLCYRTAKLLFET